MRTASCVLCLMLAACAGAQDDESHRDSRSGVELSDGSPSTGDSAGAELTGAVTSQRLRELLGRSAGDFLRNVEVDAETHAGSFVGWRLVRLPETQPSWLDIQTGDIVTAVNGLPVERPEDAQRIWEMLQVASEVRIDFIRQDERRSVRIPVEDGPESAAGSDTAAEPHERVGPEE